MEIQNAYLIVGCGRTRPTIDGRASLDFRRVGCTHPTVDNRVRLIQLSTTTTAKAL